MRPQRVASASSQGQRHGLSPFEFNAMLSAQGHVCLICGRGNRGMPWQIDHDHELAKLHPHALTTGCKKCVRGILCKTCNVGLGYFLDSPDLLERAANFIRLARVKTQR